MTYLCALLQQQLHTVSISDHTGTVQGLQSAMHPVYISSLGVQEIENVNITENIHKYYKFEVGLEDEAYLTNEILHIVVWE